MKQYLEAIEYKCHFKGTLSSHVAIANNIGKTMQAKINILEREVKYLRHYGNKDCIAMAEDALLKGELDDAN